MDVKNQRKKRTMDSREERDRLKEEYKAHYRNLLETKEKVKKALSIQQIQKVLSDMGGADLLEKMGNMVDNLKENVALAEAKLELALESIREEQEKQDLEKEGEDLRKKQQAQEAIRQIKSEMGLIQEELAKEAQNLKTAKSLGSQESKKTPNTRQTSNPESETATKKTIGKQK